MKADSDCGDALPADVDDANVRHTINFTRKHRMVALLQQAERCCCDGSHAAAEHEAVLRACEGSALVSDGHCMWGGGVGVVSRPSSAAMRLATTT